MNTMEELLKYINKEKLTPEDKNGLKILLADEKFAKDIENYLINHYKEMAKSQLTDTMEFITQLPYQDDSSGWQLATRIFCEKLYERLIIATASAIIAEPEYIEKLEILISLCEACQNVVLTPIKALLSANEKEDLKKIVIRQAMNYTMPNEENQKFNTAIEILKNLGITKTDLIKIHRIKRKQLARQREREGEIITKRRS